MRNSSLALALENPVAGHMDEKATLHRLLSLFFWPGIYQEVKIFCESCKACQFTQPKGPSGGSLIPMPIIAVPFEWIAMDLVGPLLKGTGGFEYILVVVDYATRYPEAVPLHNTEALTLARELLRVFSIVGFPREVVTDQGTNFMGWVMSNLWMQLGVHLLNTSIYYPQVNGLVERFKQSLKKMLRKFAIEEPKSWPQLIEAVLFAEREVPQAYTGYSPFERLLGRKPRGILDLAKAQWGGGENRTTGKGPMDLGQL